MKKLFIILVITCIAFNSNAQWFIGGQLGLNVSEEKNTNGAGNPGTFGFVIAPKSGYYFNEKLAIGLSFSVGANFYGSGTLFVSHSEGSVSWRVNPFVRYSILTYKRFSLILEGSTGVGGVHQKIVRKSGDVIGSMSTNEQKYSTIGIGVINIIPILGFKLTDHFQLEAGLNFLNLGYNIDIINTEITYIAPFEETRHNKTKTIRHDLNIGFNSSSILTLSQLTIGVIYKF